MERFEVYITSSTHGRTICVYVASTLQSARIEANRYRKSAKAYILHNGQVVA